MRYGVLGLILVIDQATKWWAKNILEGSMDLLSFFSFVFVKNMGVAFSMPIPKSIVIVVSLSLLGVLLFCAFRKQFAWSYGLLGVGAMGNLIDRIWHGYVVDFISIGSFPVFNVADMCITIGIGWVFWNEYKKNHE